MPTVSPIRERLTRQGRRTQLAKAAAGVFAERGSSEVSFEDIASAAGVSRSLVYKHFGDRASLLAAAYLHDLEQLDGVIERTLEGREGVDERLRAIVEAYLEFAQTNAASSKLIASLAALRHPAVQAAMDDRIDRIARHFSDSPEAHLVARGIVGLLESASIYWVDHRSIAADDVVELLVNVLRGGLHAVAPSLGYSPARQLS